jgi:hypothetical protein
MVKGYVENLTSWVEARSGQKKRMDAALVAFLAVKNDVQEAIEAGFTLATIYAHLRETGKLTCTYETFRRHVRRSKLSTLKNSRPPLPKNPKPLSSGEQPKPSTGFTFNATPKAEELI